MAEAGGAEGRGHDDGAAPRAAESQGAVEEYADVEAKLKSLNFGLFESFKRAISDSREDKDALWCVSPLPNRRVNPYPHALLVSWRGVASSR